MSEIPLTARAAPALIALAGALAALAAPSAQAQTVTSRPVVQPLPAQDTQRLNRALVALAKQPRSMEALIEAGEAALAVDDLDAALGFFGRGRELDPEDARVYLGLGRVYLRSGRPVDALPLFDQAREAGAGLRALRSDRALALDMVGEHPAAQASYRRLLESSPTDQDARRRLAISYAISGQQTEFEATLRPLIDRRDFAAFRARAFGLAILGQQQRAAAITDAVMPRTLADKVTPYLEFMPRLTSAQQAAAANLGIFPRAADIGRDTPEIATYRATSDAGDPALETPREASADSPLEPVGEPLGAPQEAQLALASPQPAGPEVIAPGPAAIDVAAPEPAMPEVAAPADLAPEAASASASPAPVSLEEAFGDLLGAGDAGVAKAPLKEAGAVDISAIEIPRERPKPPPEPEKPAHPSRIWVQLATGRDLAALAFDWRRFARQAPRLLSGFEPHTVRWGEANRLLAGPLPSREKAQDLVNALRAEGLDTFAYTSPEGTAIQQLETR